jgi:hypothetical protein
MMTASAIERDPVVRRGWRSALTWRKARVLLLSRTTAILGALGVLHILVIFLFLASGCRWTKDG